MAFIVKAEGILNNKIKNFSVLLASIFVFTSSFASYAYADDSEGSNDENETIVNSTKGVNSSVYNTTTVYAATNNSSASNETNNTAAVSADNSSNTSTVSNSSMTTAVVDSMKTPASGNSTVGIGSSTGNNSQNVPDTSVSQEEQVEENKEFHSISKDTLETGNVSEAEAEKFRVLRENAKQYVKDVGSKNIENINNKTLYPAGVYVYDSKFANISKTTLTSNVNFVLVDKSKLTTYFGSVNSSGFNMYGVVDVLVGPADGDKEKEGDKRTPEGTYFVAGHLSSERLISDYGQNIGQVYGIGAFPLDYPNVFDRAFKKTGHGIWLHGLNPVKHRPATLGCVGFENVNLEPFTPYMSIGMPVVIQSSLDFIDAKTYDANKADNLEFLQGYLTAWQNNDYEKFRGYYADNFYAGKSSVTNDYFEHKKYLMEQYPKKIIGYDGLQVYKSGKKRLFVFNQVYFAENIYSYGTKYLYTLDTDNGTKIIAERYNTLSSSDFLLGLVAPYVNDWKDAWSGKKLDDLMKFYHDNFTSNSYKSKSDLEASKSKIFENSGDDKINITISRMRIESANSNQIVVSFYQNYQLGNRSDSGTKTLVLNGTNPDNWEIIQEKWTDN